MLQKMNTDFAIKLLAESGNPADGGCLYMETGRYKPWATPVIAALRRRGYRVDKLMPGVYRLHPKD
jgi:hypothetical protein